MSLQTVKTQSKYGLIQKKGPNSARPAVALKRRVPNIFGEELEDDEPSCITQPSEIARVNRLISEQSSQKDKEIQKMHAKALEEDASIFDYDESYDSIKSSTNGPASTSKLDVPKAKYVDNLMAMAKVREKEKDRIYERKLLKERKLEDDEFKDKEKFMTEAYKQKLKEDNKWNYEDRLTEEVEKRTDVRGRGMQGFYSNLLTKNVSMGSDVATSAVSAYTAGSRRQQLLEDGAKESVDGNATNDGVGGKRKAEDIEVDERQDQDHDSLTSYSGLAPQVSSNDHVVGSTGPTEGDVANAVGVTSGVSEAVVQSARERYLARKGKVSNDG